jgi:hypothetical protein
MKKVLVLFVFAVSLSFAANAQFTKLSVDRMFKEAGTTPEKIKTLSIGNLWIFYANGEFKREFHKYEQDSPGKLSPAIFVLEEGIMIKFTRDGKFDTVRLYPYSSMKFIEIRETHMFFHLQD